MKKLAPEISLTVNGYDCGNRAWSVIDLRRMSVVCLAAAHAIENRQHGFLEEKGLIHVGIDFGGPFDEDKGLPPISFLPTKK